MKTFIILAITTVVIVSLFTWVAHALDCLIKTADKISKHEEPDMYDGDD